MRRTVPVYVLIAVLVSASSAFYALGVVTSQDFTKPSAGSGGSRSLNLKLEVLAEHYNGTRDQYDYVDITVKNYNITGTETGTFTIELYDGGGGKIAEGSQILSVASLATTLYTVMVTWETGKTVSSDYSSYRWWIL